MRAADVAEQRQLAGLGRRARHREGHTEDRVRAEPALVRRAVEVDQGLVEQPLLGRFLPDDLGTDLLDHGRDRAARRPCRRTAHPRRASRPLQRPRSMRHSAPPPGRSSGRRAAPRPRRVGLPRESRISRAARPVMLDTVVGSLRRGSRRRKPIVAQRSDPATRPSRTRSPPRRGRRARGPAMRPRRRCRALASPALRPRAALRPSSGDGACSKRTAAADTDSPGASSVFGRPALAALRCRCGRQGQGRRSERDVCDDRGIAALGRLDRLPVCPQLLVVAGSGSLEDVRMAPDQLVDQAVRHIVDRPTLASGQLLGHPRVKGDLKQHVAQLLAQAAQVRRPRSPETPRTPLRAGTARGCRDPAGRPTDTLPATSAGPSWSRRRAAVAPGRSQLAVMTSTSTWSAPRARGVAASRPRGRYLRAVRHGQPRRGAGATGRIEQLAGNGVGRTVGEKRGYRQAACGQCLGQRRHEISGKDRAGLQRPPRLDAEQPGCDPWAGREQHQPRRHPEVLGLGVAVELTVGFGTATTASVALSHFP